MKEELDPANRPEFKVILKGLDLPHPFRSGLGLIAALRLGAKVIIEPNQKNPV